MKLSETVTFTFREALEHIRSREARRAASQLILYRDGDLVERHLCLNSGFCRACVGTGCLSEDQMRRAAQRYRLGMARDGGVIFWQIGPSGEVYDGKVMYYREDCHRDHSQPPTWVSAELKRFYLGDDDPLAQALPPSHCLFGTHLLGEAPSAAVAVVEAEKTAVILSERYPQYLWLAAGGLSELSAVKLFPLRNRRVVLFPDTDPDGTAYKTWYHVACEARRLLGHPVYLSPLLEQRATAAQKRRKIDLVDFLLDTE